MHCALSNTHCFLTFLCSLSFSLSFSLSLPPRQLSEKTKQFEQLKQEQQDKIKEAIRVQVDKDKIKIKDMEERETTLRTARKHLEQERTNFEKHTVAAEQKQQLLEQQYLKKWAALEKLQQKTQVLQTKGKH